jgi:hypothetical protein
LNGKALGIAYLFLDALQSTRTDEWRYLSSKSGIHRRSSVAAHAETDGVE